MDGFVADVVDREVLQRGVIGGVEHDAFLRIRHLEPEESPPVRAVQVQPISAGHAPAVDDGVLVAAQVDRPLGSAGGVRDELPLVGTLSHDDDIAGRGL